MKINELLSQHNNHYTKCQRSFLKTINAVIGDEAHLFKAVSLTKIMTKLTDCKYRIGHTGTLDNSKTHKLVLQGLFGSVNKVVSTTTYRQKTTCTI